MNTDIHQFPLELLPHDAYSYVSNSDLETNINSDLSHCIVQVLVDAGLYKHFKVSSPYGWNNFELVTFPYSLVITGQMGSYIFSREENMFDFFNSKIIKSSYWAHKCTSHSTRSGDILEYSSKTFKKYLKDRLTTCYGSNPPKNVSKQVASLISEDSFGSLEEFIYFLHSNDFPDEETREFFSEFFSDSDYGEDWKIYNYHFEFCLASILMIIKSYYKHK